jgi:hypothetical protein
MMGRRRRRRGDWRRRGVRFGEFYDFGVGFISGGSHLGGFGVLEWIPTISF